MPPLTSLQLGRVLRHCLSSSSSSSFIRINTFSPRLATTYFPKLQFLSRHFSSQELQPQDINPVALSISTELLQSSNTDPLSVSERLHLNFSHITPTSSLVLQTLNLSPDAGRTVLGFHQWLVSSADFKHTDDTLSFFIDYFGRRKDFKATDEILEAGKGVAGDRTLESVIDRLVRAGRPTQVVGFFDRMEREYGFKRDKNSLKMVVEKLCEHGYASCAEKMVKNLANVVFPDEVICDLLIKGWCVDGKLEEAKRLAGEMYRGGFEIGITSYNAILDCVCKLCRQKDPFRLQLEAEKVLLDMETHGVPRNVETYNVLISNLCKIRKTEDAMNLFHRMGEWGCYPDETTFIGLIRSLYQAARVSEGDEMIDRMKSAGYGGKLDKKAYYGFLKILCGIERLEHAMTVFKKMKDDGCEPGIKTYDLLMGKWCSLKRVDKANALFNEALKNGVPVTPKEYKVDPRFLKKPKVDEKNKKRETLPEKMARKRRRLKQIRLSFVKKPQKMMRRAI
ncbi:pentatricopeptide repeat-containing protein PNM1 mitochondrial [Tripterygium wilfordii]|uniref:Pentatricopeptide repeat-containing protein PNM1 mitochondrial n=1 Tax=Tripterygium wilfordii TaxID=458696 RepID=A0A7J7CJ67_TRIWF|nr:pentatricopeptide repeat-containing protein PNM1, mitochondrial-like [Tripterygium wilfordii]XP_038679884.1 pentatricopeptide repeat-containing protein PNM1, mitochondrial-like [Tripterygium wilfordii]XP_038679885.1 pentatricopeptide repeat-containing protein PNM1, mitochondrial-like [Tripterygium wilfordii]XP_038679886.1 pentatricopeptide repeat-containing protein PNM1, mitochondrial-like [Tripterygium wilfordii]KAF5734113.1 pentatricopeptide repeat-containing protein PNM1 mitochondrial [Tr